MLASQAQAQQNGKTPAPHQTNGFFLTHFLFLNHPAPPRGRHELPTYGNTHLRSDHTNPCSRLSLSLEIPIPQPAVPRRVDPKTCRDSGLLASEHAAAKISNQPDSPSLALPSSPLPICRPLRTGPFASTAGPSAGRIPKPPLASARAAGRIPPPLLSRLPVSWPGAWQGMRGKDKERNNGRKFLREMEGELY